MTAPDKPKKLTIGRGFGRRLTKAGEAANRRFDAAVVAYLVSVGAAQGAFFAWHVNTSAGPLAIWPRGSWIACCFADRARAHAVLGHTAVGYSGKWNHHYEVGCGEAELADFKRQLERILPDADANQARIDTDAREATSNAAKRDTPDPETWVERPDYPDTSDE